MFIDEFGAQNAGCDVFIVQLVEKNEVCSELNVYCSIFVFRMKSSSQCDILFSNKQ